MPKLTNEAREKAHAEIEAVMEAGQWSLRMAHALGRKHGVTGRMIMIYKRQVEKRLRDSAWLGDIEDERAGFLHRNRSAQQACIRKSDFRALASLQLLEMRVIGIESPQRVHVTGGLDITARPERQLTDEELIARIEAKRKEKAGQVIELREVSAGEGYEPEG